MASYPADAVRLVPTARACTICGAMTAGEEAFAEHYANHHAAPDEGEGDDQSTLEDVDEEE